MVYNMPIMKVYDLNTLCKIHKIIFENIYEWAGQIRKSDFLSKGGSIFCRGQYIAENANKIFGNILEGKCLCGLKKTKFIERIAYYMGEVNALHPFREGNGRTCREFFRQLSLNANYILDFSQTEKDELLEADIEAFNGQYGKLIKILDKAVIVR
jgi:cell filamentation protein